MISNLVIGGAGYTGSLLVKKLLNNNQKVTVVDNFMYDKNSLNSLKNERNLKIINQNIFQYKFNKDDFNNYDFIYPLSGLVGDPICRYDKKKTLTYNVDSLKLILDNFISKKSKIIYPSSCSVYGLVEQEVDETDILNPQSLYAETKIECENMLRKLDKKNLIILRLPTIFGISLRQRFDLVVNKMTLDLLKKNVISVYNPPSMRPLLSVEDLANIYISCQKVRNKFKTYNIGSSKNNFSLEKIARLITKTLSAQLKKTSIQYFDENEDPRSYSIKLNRFKEFNYKSFYSLENQVIKMSTLISSSNRNYYKSKKYNNILE